MTRAELEHAIREAYYVSGDGEFMIIGSQAILAQFPDAPEELRLSEEVDLYPRTRQDRSDAIEGTLGYMSLFHETHGFYVDAVGPETARLPRGWERRVVRVESQATGGAAGLCAEVHDVAAGKLAIPTRDKDTDFLRALLQHRMVNVQTLRRRVMALPVDAETFRWVSARLEGLVREVEVARRPAGDARAATGTSAHGESAKPPAEPGPDPVPGAAPGAVSALDHPSSSGVMANDAHAGEEGGSERTRGAHTPPTPPRHPRRR